MRKIQFIAFTFFAYLLYANEPVPTTMTRAQLRAFLEQTETLYLSDEPEDVLKAAQNFQALAHEAPEGEMDLDALALAESMALLKAGNPQQALDRIEQIEGFDTTQERSRARLMKGNAQRQLSEAAIAVEDWENAKAQMTSAIESYKNSLREETGSEAARHNLELANKRLEEIIEMTPPPPEDQESEDQEQEDQNQDQEKEENDDENSEDQGDETNPSDQSDQTDEQDRSEETDEDKDQDQDQEQDQDQQQEQDQEQPEESDEQDSSEEADSSDQSSQVGEGGDPAEELDARQAQQLLEAALEQEKRQRRQILEQRVRPIPVEKNW